MNLTLHINPILHNPFLVSGKPLVAKASPDDFEDEDEDDTFFDEEFGIDEDDEFDKNFDDKDLEDADFDDDFDDFDDDEFSNVDDEDDDLDNW